jgi:hypothetical protein
VNTVTQKSFSNQNSRQQISERLSPELEQKIKVANKQWGKAKNAVLDVYKQALHDGWTSIEAAKICREKLVIFSPRTIRGILPDEAKNQNMKRVQEQVSKVQEAQPQIAESLPQNVVITEEKQPEVNLQQSDKPAVMSNQVETAEEDDNGDYEQLDKSPISVEQELKHDDAVDDQYHHMCNLIELLSGIDYIKEQEGNLALVERTKEHRFNLIKKLSDLDVKTIYTYGRTLSLILNDYMKQLDNELGIRQAKEKLVSE